MSLKELTQQKKQLDSKILDLTTRINKLKDRRSVIEDQIIALEDNQKELPL